MTDQRDHPRDHDGNHSGHSHGVSRTGEVAGVSDARLLWSVVLNQLLTVGQVVAGVLSGSIALLSDAAHNFNDANALLIAYIARRISRKQANQRFTFGYRRAEMIGAIINLTLLGVIGSLDRVKGLHHLHIWELDEQHRALEAHVVITRARFGELEGIKRQIKGCLSDEFQIRHSTLEFEFDDELAATDHDMSLIAEH